MHTQEKKKKLVTKLHCAALVLLDLGSPFQHPWLTGTKRGIWLYSACREERQTSPHQLHLNNYVPVFTLTCHRRNTRQNTKKILFSNYLTGNTFLLVSFPVCGFVVNDT